MAGSIIALVFLIGAIALGFVRKVNVGIVCLGLALILGKIGGISDGDIYSGFPYKLFATLLGTMLFFSLLQQNGTLEKISKTMIGLCGKNVFLMPIIIYVVSFLLSAAGPGAISVMSVTVLFAVPLAIQMDASPVLFGGMAIIGAVGGTASPIALTGIIVGGLLEEMNITGMGMQIFAGVTVTNVVCAILTYVGMGGYKLKPKEGTGAGLGHDKEPLTKDQLISLIALLIMVVLVVGFAYDVGLICLTLSLILILLKVSDEKKAVKSIPWSTLLLISGVNVLMTVTQAMGGIDLLADILASFMSERTAVAFMGLTGGIMSWFSSANGVVFPTLIPTIPDIAAQVGNVSLLQMVVAVVCSATVAGISPMSTGGSLIMASYTQETGCDEKTAQKLFAKCFILSAAVVVIVFILTLIGLLSVVGLK